MLVFVTTNSDIINLNKSLKQPDKDEFINAIHQKLNDLISRKYWMIVPLNNVPLSKSRLHMAWSMKSKCNLVGEAVKCKSKLCASGIALLSLLTIGIIILLWSHGKKITMYSL